MLAVERTRLQRLETRPSLTAVHPSQQHPGITKRKCNKIRTRDASLCVSNSESSPLLFADQHFQGNCKDYGENVFVAAGMNISWRRNDL